LTADRLKGLNLPAPEVLAAFGLYGPLELLAGGQGVTWRVGEAVVKQLDMTPSMVAWQGGLLSRLDGRHDFRVSVPLKTAAGLWTTAGWSAWRYQPGAHVSGRWHDIISVGQRLHAALAAEPEPDFLPHLSDKWSIGNKVAWGELPAANYTGTKHLSKLSSALRPVRPSNQLVHGDLTGNVLFHDDLPPLVIDLSPYWRPPAFASAIVVADALLFHGAGKDVIEPLLDDPAFPQYLLRALIFRAVTDHLARPDLQRVDADDPYLAAVELALRLAAALDRGLASRTTSGTV